MKHYQDSNIRGKLMIFLKRNENTNYYVYLVNILFYSIYKMNNKKGFKKVCERYLKTHNCS